MGRRRSAAMSLFSEIVCWECGSSDATPGMSTSMKRATCRPCEIERLSLMVALLEVSGDDEDRAVATRLRGEHGRLTGAAE